MKARHKAKLDTDALSAEDRTVTELCREYIDEREGILSPVTIHNYRKWISRIPQDVARKKPSQISNWQSVISRECVSTSVKSVRNIIKFIKAVYNKNGLPFPKVMFPKSKEKEQTYLTPEQIPVFLDAIKDSPCELIYLLCLHGLRRSEAAGMTLDRINLRKRTITVDGEMTDVGGQSVRLEHNKTKASARVVPIMIPRLVDVVKQTPEDYPFYNRMLAAKRSIDKLSEECGLPHLSLHSLRRSFASLCYHLNIPERVTMKMGGWSDITTMHKFYIKISEQDVTDYADRISRFFSE